MKVLYITPFYSSNLEGKYARFHDIVEEIKSKDDIEYDVLYFYTRDESNQKVVKVNSKNSFFKKVYKRSPNYDIVHIVTTGSVSGCLIPSFLIRNKNLVIGPTILGYEPIRYGSRWDLKKMSNLERMKAISDFSIRRFLLSSKSPFSKRLRVVLSLGKYHNRLLEHMGVPREKIVELPPGVNKNVFKPQSSNKRVDPKLKLLYIGEYSQYKGYDLFLKALSKIKDKIDFKAVIIGKGRVDMNKIESYGLANKIVHKNYVPRKDLANYYRECDLYVHPSYDEANPTTMIESLACGTPVLATDGEGFIENKIGENCLFFRRGDPENLDEKIQEFYENRRFYDNQALENHGEYDIKKTSETLISSYEEIL